MPGGIFWNAATRWVARELNGLTSLVRPPPRAPDDAEPRRILLVHAHPVSDSYSAALADAVALGAREGGHELRRRSLYAENFRPELTEAERECYFDVDRGASRISPDVRSHLADLRWADSLVLVYPTWWFGMPAMLKGYFDRTLVRGEAWDFPARGGKGGEVAPTTSTSGLVPRLTNIRRVMGVSTYGATRGVALLAGDNGRSCVGTAIRKGNFASGCTCLWLGLYGMDDCTAEEREEFSAAVQRAVREEF
jgi:NAD(P)H dehydrogenase (quinone)